jgi:hypothetical protein
VASSVATSSDPTAVARFARPSLREIVSRRSAIVRHVREHDNGAGAYVFGADLTAPKRVTNLGWILRHKDDILHPLQGVGFDVHGWSYRPTPTPPIGVDYFLPVMLAHLSDGRTYACAWQDASVLHGWLNRPSFRGYLVDWCLTPSGSSTCAIGGADYRQLSTHVPKGV